MRSFLIVLLMLVAVPALAGQNVVIVVDDSSSMSAWMNAKTTRIMAAREALKETISKLPPDTRVGIITLNGSWKPSEWLVPFAHINKERAIQQIETLQENGSTPLGAAMKAGCDVLLADREQNGYGIYTLLVVTDGEAGDQSAVDAYVEDIKSRGIVIDAIGVDMAKDHSLATKVHAYRRANDSESLMKALSETFAETNVDDKAAADEDFALLEGLPEGAAEKMIAALAKGNNVPIGEKQLIATDDDGKIQFDTQGNVVVVPPSHFPWWIVCSVGAVALLLVIFAAVAVANS